MYKVLARKYRPTKLSEIIGQDIAVRILKNAIDADRLHHAILLAGPMGVGKTSTARIIAKSLNCEKGTSSEPCNECESCISITKGKSVDVVEIDGASNRKVDDARNIIESVKYPPLKSRFKIYIIDEVHMLTIEAFNALLKTIEEPPDYVKFIFATTAMEKIPDTILSRCQIITLKKIPTDLIKIKLKGIAEKENVKIEDGALDIIAFASFGSMRVAEGYLDRCIAYKPEDLTQSDVSRVVGVSEKKTIEEYFSDILSKNTSSALSKLQLLDERDANFEIFVRQCIDFLLGLQDVVLEHKTALLNIYYTALIDIKQKVEPLSVLNVATHKASAVLSLEQVESIIEKLSNMEFSDIPDNKQNETVYDNGNSAAEESKPEKKETSDLQSTDSSELDENVRLILKEFEGKIITVEKLNK